MVSSKKTEMNEQKWFYMWHNFCNLLDYRKGYNLNLLYVYTCMYIFCILRALEGYVYITDIP